LIDLDAKVVVKGSELGMDYADDTVVRRMAQNTERAQNELNQPTDRKISQKKL
jgi:hypothetical protein